MRHCQNTRQALSSLRQALGIEAERLLRPAYGAVRLNLTGADVDVLAFDRWVSHDDPVAWREAFALYRGPLLEGWSDPWVLEARARRQRSYGRLLRRLIVHAQAAGDDEQTTTYLRSALACTPEEESLWRELLTALARQGRIEAAEEEYQRLRYLLDARNQKPEAETEAVIADLRMAALTAPARSPVRANLAPPNIGAALPPTEQKRPPSLSEEAGRAALAPRLPGVPDTFAPHPAPSAPPNNLPAAPNAFIGRNREITQISELLAEARLVTLTGAGGCGKTRLALQVAGTLLETYPDGVWLLELASLSDPVLLPRTVASALGLTERVGHDPTQALIDHLKPRRLLLIVDNCEHLLSGCSVLMAALLRTCPHLKALATSREPMGIAAEHAYRVPPLALPDPARSLPWEEIGQYEAIRLFTERARKIRSDFALTARNAEVVRQICARLDGIPLAIELAAARIRVLSAEEIRSRLDDRFRLLRGGDRAAPPHQQTLRGLIDWSYELLSPEERTLLQRLSVFAGGWTLEAAEAVCEDGVPTVGASGAGREPLRGGVRENADPERMSPNTQRRGSTKCERPGERLTPNASLGAQRQEIEDLNVLDLLTGLVDKSLVGVEEHEGGTRYRLLETVREYAAEKLRASGEEEAIHNRHLDCFLALAVQAAPHLKQAEQQLWLERLEREHENLRTALAWCAEAPERAEAGLRLAGELGLFWITRGHFTEGLAHLERALEREEAQTRTPARALALAGVGHIVRHQGDQSRAGALYAESESIYRELGDAPGLATIVANLGILAFEQGDHDRARRLTEEALSFYTDLGHRWGVARAQTLLGNIMRRQGDYEQARQLLEAGLALHRELEDKQGLAMSLAALGMVASEQGDLQRASGLYEERLRLAREMGDRHSIAQGLLNLGHIAHEEGDYAQARELTEECLGLFRELEHRRGVAFALLNLGLIAHAQGDADWALKRVQEGMRILKEQGYRREAIAALEMGASVLVSLHAEQQAARLWGAAEALREDLGEPLPQGQRAQYERDVAQAQTALGAESLEVAWKEGRAMTWEQALDLALEQHGRPGAFRFRPGCGIS